MPRRPVPPETRGEIDWLCGLITERGDPAKAHAEIEGLRRAVQSGSPVLSDRVQRVINLGLKRPRPALTAEEFGRAARLATALADWQGDGPGPPKQFPHQFVVLLGDAELSALETLSAQEGENRSAVIRRLLREAAEKQG